MAYDDEHKTAHRHLWDDNHAPVNDEDIAGAEKDVVSADVSVLGDELALKLTFDDGSHQVVMVNPLASKNIGYLLLEACTRFGWFNIDLRINERGSI